MNLLQQWEALDHQAQEAVRSFQKRGREVRALLMQVSDRIESGHWHTAGWNVFEILGRVRLEDAHSDALAWLFKPWEAHGLGDRFLQDFVHLGTGESLANSRVREVQTRKTVGVGRRKIDIEVQGDGWVLAVENKIDHSETPGQTEYYAAHYRRLRNAGTTVFGVFLTPTGEAAKSEFFQPMSYRTLRTILDQNQPRTPSDAAQLVRWFADHIRGDLEVDL
ncbi:MAG: PD-(D/E)XK nuclease family protein [Bryobacteraceae bacterium]